MPSYYTTTLFKMVGSTLKSCMPAAAMLSLLIVFACSKEQNKQMLVFSQGENTIEAQARDYKIAFNDQQVGIQLESGEKASLQLATEATAVQATKGELLYKEVAEHTDLKFYDKGNGNVGYDFILEPGADVENVRFKLDNGTDAYINEDAELAIPVEGGEMRHSKPIAYQEIEGQRIAVSSCFVLKDGDLGFRLGRYDEAYTVVIDPEIYFAPAPKVVEEEMFFTTSVECERGVTNTVNCQGGSVYVIYLSSPNDNDRYSSSNLVWKENTDGTATLTGTADNTADNEVLTVDMQFSGKTSTAPSGSPRGHSCENENSSGWFYYTSMSGTLTSSTTGEVLQITRRGEAFQVGYGANTTSTGLGFGASGWFDVSGSNKWEDGDFNLMLDENCSTSCNGVNINALKIYDQSTNAEASGIGPITNGASININDLPANYYLVAEVSNATQSVKIDVNGTEICENVSLYTFPAGGASWNAGVGNYTVNLKANSQDNCVSVCEEMTISFSIVSDECETYERTDHVAIPDNGCSSNNNAVYTINVPDNITISDLNVGIAIDHTYREDINLKLRAPDGTEQELFSTVGGNGYDFDIILDSDASNNITSISRDYYTLDGSPFYEDTFTPETSNALDVFDGKNAAGDWKIIVCDSYSQDYGSIIRAKLEICGGASCELAVDTGNDVNNVCEGDEVVLTATVSGEGSCTTGGVSECGHTIVEEGGYIRNKYAAEVCGDNSGAKLWTQSGDGTAFLVFDLGTSVPAGTQVCVNAKLEHCSNTGANSSTMRVRASNTSSTSGFTTLGDETFSSSNYQEYCFTLSSDARYIRVQDQGDCSIRVDYVRYETQGTSNSNITYQWTTTDGNIVGASDGMTLKVDKAGTYKVKVTDCKGCEAMDEVVVTTTKAVIQRILVDDITCEGGDGQLRVDPNMNAGTTLPIEIYYTFEGVEIFAGDDFNSTGTGNIITGLASGEYTNIRIVDANGCQDVEAGPFTIGSPTGCSGSETLMCEDGTVIMSMERLRRNAVTTETIDLPSIVTGLIEVSALTFDEYTNRVNVTQLNEQVKIQFLSQGEVVTETGFTTDIPDQVVRGEIVTDFGQIDLGNLGVDQIKIVHADDSNSGFGSTDGSPNSIQGVEICLVDLLEFDDCCNPADASLYTLDAPRVQDGTGTNTLEESFSIEGVSDIQLCSRFNSFGNLDKTGDYVDIFYKVDNGSFVKLANQNRDYSPCSQDTDPNRIDGSRTLAGVESCSYDWYDYPVQAEIPVTGSTLTIKVEITVNGSEGIEMTSLTLCGKACSIEVNAGDPVTVCDGENATLTAEVSNFESCVTCSDLGSDWTLIGELNGIGYYKYNNGAKSYTDARNLATSEGGFLPIVTSQEINDFLKDNVSEGIWIGFTDEAVEGTFVWEDGSPVSYTNWNSGEPNNSGDEDYTEFIAGSGKWNDLPNGNHQDVVIQLSCPPSNDITYTWSGPNNFSASTAEIMVGTAGTYMVTVEDCNGCIATDEVVLDVDDTEITTNESTNKEICDGESVTFTVQTNATNPPYTDIEFIRFGSMVADPYSASGGTFLGEFDLTATSGSITTSDFPNTDPKKNETYFVYACVKPAPADGFCKPFVKYTVVVEDNPNVSFSKVNPDCDETTGTITFTYTPHDNRGNIEFQLEQNGSIVEAYSDNNVGDGSSSYSITGLAPGTYDVSARWGNDECEVDLGQTVIEPVPVVCDVPEICVEGIVVDFDTAPDGTPLVSGTTDIEAEQPYANIFGAGSGVMFSTNDPTNKPLNLYDSEDPIGLDPDLERNDDGDGFWEAGNLANQPLFNLLIINQTSDLSQPNDNSGGGMIMSSANQFLDAFSFDVVDLDDAEMGDAEIVFENTVTGETATLNLDVFEDVASNTSPFKVLGVTYIERSANRISDITAEELGISSFNKITFNLNNGVTLGIGSICFKLAELGAIGNYVWVDEDSNGLQDAGEPGIPNVKVNLFYDTDGSGGLNGGETTPIATTFTDAQGGYLFPDLPQGMYFVKVDDSTIPTGMTQTTIFTNVVDGSDADTDPDDGDLGNKDQSGDGYKITLDTGEENLTADFGYNYNPTDDVNDDEDLAAIGDRVWIDSDGDGVQDPNEIGVEGVEVTLTGAGDDGIFGTGDDVTATTTTDENGYYLFDDLVPGAYMTEVTDDAGATYEVLNTTNYDQTGDPDDFGEPASDPDNKLTDAVLLGPGDVFLNADYGYQPTDANNLLSAIGDFVWFDADKDGNGPSLESPEEGGGAIVQGGNTGTADPEEYGIEGVSVALIRDENANGVWDDGEPIIATDVTDENGFYYFPDLIQTGGTGTDDYLVWVNDTDNVLDDLRPTFDKDGGSVPFETGAPIGEDADGVLGISAVTNLGTSAAPGASRLMQDFGYAPRTNSSGDGLIGDYVWFDDNRDGVQDPDEEGIEGVVVELYDLGADDMVGGGDDVLIATAITDENGYYYFGGLSLDDEEGDNDFAYQVIIADENFDPGKPLQGFENTADPDSGTASPDNEGGEVVLNGGNTQDLDQDFGYAGQNDATPVGSIGDTVFEDKDADGVRDEGEEGIAGVTIDLYRDLNGNGELDPGEPKIATETTDENGMYLFTDLPINDQGGDNDADYIVDVTDVDGILIGYWHSTSPNQDATTNGGDDDTAMDDTGDNSKEDAFAVAIDATIPNNRNVDFGYYKDLAALGNYVWLDTNKNGLQDDGETGINDVEVKLTIEYPNGDMVTVVTTTEDDADGNPGFYDFPNLLADEDYNMGSMGAPTSLPQFTISVDENQTAFTLANLSPTLTDVNANGNDLEDSDDFDGVVAKPIQGEEDTSAKDPATDEEVIASYDFGVQKNLLGAIGNYVWLDENSDGFQDAGEPGIPNVKVDLKDEDGNVIATAFTDSDGGYLFPDLPTGMYFVDVDESTLPDTDGNPMTQDLTQTTVFTNSGDNVPSDDVDEGDFGNKDQSVGDGYKVTLDEGEENLTADFGYNYNPTDDVDDGENTAALGDRVWIDSDGDGAQDPEEIGVEGVEVTLTGAGDDGIFGTADDVTATTTTDENGFYLFDDLEPGAYMVEVTEDAGASHDILDDNAYDQTGDPDDFGMLATNPDDKTTTPVILAPGDVFLNADFGYQPDDNTPLGSIGNTVWLDADADGNGPADVNGDTSNGAGVEDDDNEEPIEGVTVVLVKDEDGDGIWDEGEPIIATDVTDENGQYLFEDLPIDDGAGTDDYIVAVTDTDNILSGLKGTYDDDGGMDELGSLFPTTGDPTDPSQVLGVSAVTDLDATPVTDQDFGYTPETQDDGEGLIGDYVWFDENGDGVQDPEEEGIEGVVVELYDPGADMVPGGGDDVLLATTTTDENGYYYFGGLDADDDKYYVKVSDENFDPNGVLEGMENTEDPDGDDDSEGGTVTLTNADPIDLDQDFGYRAPMNADGTIGTLVWEDVNADGNRDAGEEGFEGVTVDLYRDLNSNGLIDAGEPIFASTATDMNGDYLFENLPFGDYIVDVTDEDGVLVGYWHSLGEQAENGTDDESKEDPYGADGGITINAGAPDYVNADFGYYVLPGALGNYVWIDTNGNGLQDDGETGVNDIEVTLTIEYPNGDEITVVTTTIDDASGNPGFYDFQNLLLDEDYNMGTLDDASIDGLPLFTISVDETQTEFTDNNLIPTTDDVNANMDDLADSDDFDGVVAKPTQGATDTSAKDPSTTEEEIASYDFGVKESLPGAIGNYVWLDENSDGFQDVGEPGIPNVQVDLKDENGVVIATTYTDAQGGYLFPDLMEGTYFVDVVESTLPDGVTQTTIFTNSLDDKPFDDVDDGDFGNKNQGVSFGYQVDLDSGEENMTADFGYNYNPTDDVDNGEETAALGDRVWIDSDGDGMQDPEEIGVSGVEVTLTGAGPDGVFGTGDDITETTITDDNGFYLFDDLTPGAYTVEVTDDAGASHDILEDDDYDQTGDPDDFGEPAMNPDDKTTTPVILAPGDVFLNADFGYQPDDTTELGSIGNTVWLDADADGNGPSDVNGDASNGAGVEDDDDEEPISGVSVALVKDTNGNGVWDAGEPIIATDVTDEDGQYLFEDLPITDGAGSDDYIVVITDTENILSDLKGTYDRDGGDDQIGSLAPTMGDPTDPSEVLGVTAVSDLTAAPVTDADFGYTPESQDDGEGLIGDYVWFDEDGDGVQDPDEEGIEGVKVELLRAYEVINSGIDVDGDGDVDANDDGTLDGIAIIDGRPDTNGDGNTNVSDDGFIFGVEIINGRVDVDGNGIVSNPDRANDDGVIGELLAVTCTDENGYYYFGGLDVDPDGVGYQVKVADSASASSEDNFAAGKPLEGTENTFDPDDMTTDPDNMSGIVTLSDNDPVDLDQDFGYNAPDNADGSIGNFVWEDTNADGDVDAGEMGIDGITLDLYRDLNSNGVVDPGEPLFASTTTAGGGAYLFDNLPFGDYIVDVTDEAGLLNGYWHSLGDQAELGTDNESKIDPYGADGGITINAGAPDYLFADFGYYVRPAALGNFVWNDLDSDGIQDANEPGINGVEVTLTIMYPDGVTTTTVKTTTATINGKDGSYNFGNLLLDEDYNAGTSGDPVADDLPKFTISVDETQTPIADLNLVPTLTDVTTVDATDLNDSDNPVGVTALPTQGQEDTTPLADPDLEEVIASYDFGFAKFVSIGSTVYIDEDNNGFQDAGDDGIEDVTVIIYQDTDGNGVIDGTEDDMPFRSTVTNADGEYFFDNLPEGKYQVVIPVENFQTGGTLNAFAQSATGATTDPNDDTDRDDNGSQPAIGQETTSPVYMLMAGMEPISGGGAMDESDAFGGDQDGGAGSPRDRNGNMTVDFAFLNVPLPVELLAFKATPDVDHIDLTWITASEIDNDYFDLERGTDGKTFKAIAQLDGQGSTLEQTTYTHEDATVQPNVLYYYRLRQVDFDGTFEYSEIITAQISGEKEGGMELYPNPVGVGSTLNVRLFTEELTAELYIMDVEGRIIRTIKRDIVNTGWNVIEIEVADLAVGTYMIADRSGEVREFVKAE